MLEALTAALAAADLDALVALLHPDAIVVGDGGGKERTARLPVSGAVKVARFLLGLQQRYGSTQDTARPVMVNGDLGLLIPAWPGDADHPTPLARRVACIAVRDGRLVAIYDIVNPDKLAAGL
ncbi:MAG: hypothetical protein GEV09_24560 [Pseudonocardiaceae bacterium]|nr:hypothetical protein [Pseudonocardiaceae bacterium]